MTPDKEKDRVDMIRDREIVTEMQESYLDYAMSVIVARSLPDVRDGLKPVHRRILFAMHEMGLHAGTKYKKSARVVGDVLGKYHPHGDTAVYDSLVRMAQYFSLRYPLIDGQGNFGSIDGDGAAAMRYTEVKMRHICDELLADIEKETVGFRPNYDGTQDEPVVLPTKIPNLLVNGTEGIAVGMATRIPPHNLREVMDALIHYSKNPDCSVSDLLQYIQGPDFPTKGLLYDTNNLLSIYETGRGSITIRARALIEDAGKGRQTILITEIPYQVNKSTLITKIADLVRDKKIVGITDIRDESNKEDVRIVIELKKDSFPKKIMNQLFKYTPLETSFSFNMIALVDGIQPELLNLKTMLQKFWEHRLIVFRKKTEFDLRKAEERAHILEGLTIALDHIDEVIATIRASETKDEARVSLREKFGLSDLQAEAILMMRLQALAGLERKRILDELEEKRKLIERLRAILDNEDILKAEVLKECEEIKKQYGDDRKTEVVQGSLGKMSIADTIPDVPMMVLLTKENYIKRVATTTWKTQHRGGKGIIGMTTKDEDEIIQIVSSRNLANLLYFTNTGRVFRLPVYEIPEATRTSKGVNIVNLLNLGEGENIALILEETDQGDGFLYMATKLGTVKKTQLADFKNIRTNGLIAIKLRDGDELRWVRLVEKGDKICMISRYGQSIIFEESDVRPMGRNSSGVRGMNLKKDDSVVEMDVIKPTSDRMLLITEKGFGKVTDISEYRVQNRGGSGIKTAMLTDKTGFIIGASILVKDWTGDVLLISRQGQILRTLAKEVPARGRVTQGVCVMRFKEKGDYIASYSLIDTMLGMDVEMPTEEAEGEDSEVQE